MQIKSNWRFSYITQLIVTAADEVSARIAHFTEYTESWGGSEIHRGSEVEDSAPGPAAAGLQGCVRPALSTTTPSNSWQGGIPPGSLNSGLGEAGYCVQSQGSGKHTAWLLIAFCSLCLSVSNCTMGMKSVSWRL